MEDDKLKKQIGANIASYRKRLRLTQAGLAEKLNYSDKAVSKWERGESVPDITVLKQMADFYGVTIDTLISEPKEKVTKPPKSLAKKRAIISLVALGFVWLVAICGFVFIDTFFPKIEKTWMSFIYAIPVSCTVLFILTSLWGKSLPNMILMSVFVWTLILSIFLTINIATHGIHDKLWQIFLIGIPIQALIIFGFLYKKTK